MVVSLFNRPIGYHPDVARWLGSVRAAIVLSQSMYWLGKSSTPGTAFWKTQDEWTEETALSKYAQRKARETLSKHDWWIEEKRGVPAKLWYDIDIELLESEFRKWQKSRREGDSASFGTVEKQGLRRSNNKDCDGRNSITETTTEITTEREHTRENNNTSTESTDEQTESPGERAIRIDADTPDQCDRAGRKPVDETDRMWPEEYQQLWRKHFGQFLKLANTKQRDRMLFVLQYWTDDELREAFKVTGQGATRPGWGYFRRVLEGMAADGAESDNGPANSAAGSLTLKDDATPRRLRLWLEQVFPTAKGAAEQIKAWNDDGLTIDDDTRDIVQRIKQSEFYQQITSEDPTDEPQT